jgi:hypothetical protein
MLSLSEAIKARKLNEYAAQEEACGVGPIGPRRIRRRSLCGSFGFCWARLPLAPSERWQLGPFPVLR